MSQTNDPTAENVQVVRRFFEEVVNQRAFHLAAELLAPDAELHAASLLLLGWDEWLKSLEKIWKAFPDARVEINQVTAEGDRVAFRMTMEGTQHGEFAQIPPRLRKVSISSAALVQLKQGLIQSIEFYFDSTAVLQQIAAAYPGGHEGNGKSRQPYPPA